MLKLPLGARSPATRPDRSVERVMARALRLALVPGRPADTSVDDLCEAASGRPLVLTAALGRLERAAVAEPSRTVGQAVSLLRAAMERSCTPR